MSPAKFAAHAALSDAVATLESVARDADLALRVDWEAAADAAADLNDAARRVGRARRAFKSLAR